jgi:hypothetical protein
MRRFINETSITINGEVIDNLLPGRWFSELTYNKRTNVKDLLISNNDYYFTNREFINDWIENIESTIVLPVFVESEGFLIVNGFTYPFALTGEVCVYGLFNNGLISSIYIPAKKDDLTSPFDDYDIEDFDDDDL